MNNLQPKPYDIAFLCGRFQLIHKGFKNSLQKYKKTYTNILSVCRFFVILFLGGEVNA